MTLPSSTELTLRDDGISGVDELSHQSSAEALAAKLGLSDATPPMWQQQMSKFGNVLFNSSVVALLRVWMRPPPVEAPPNAGVTGVPEWYAEEWTQRTRGQRLASRVLRDTAAFVAGCYLMDAVDAGMREVRGKEDQYNKIMGGVAAGGLLGFAWYPSDPRGRSAVTVAGAMVGLVTWMLDQGSKTYMLQAQRELEKELLHKTEDQLRPELNQWYLRSLVRAKQEQAVAARRAAMERELQRRGSAASGGLPGGGMDGTADGGVQDLQGLSDSGAASSAAPGGEPHGFPPRSFAEAGMAAAAAAAAAAAGGGGAGGGGAASSRSYRGGGGWTAGGGGRTAGSDGGVLVITEEGDSSGEDDGRANDAEVLRD